MCVKNEKLYTILIQKMGDPITNNLITLISANSLTSLKTGHIFFDIFIALLLIFLLPRISKLWKKVPLTKWLKKKELANMKFVGIERHSINTSGPITREYSDNFCAITKYIERSGKVNFLREYFLKSTYDGKKVQFRPQSSELIKLTSSISCKIYISYTENQDTTELTIYSDKGMEDIQEFLKLVTREYNNYMDEQLNTQQHYFSPYISRKGYVEEWIKFNFQSSKTFSKVFFPEKSEVLKEIDYFVNGKEIYDSKGVPWQLGILLHGKPGTGKSSFIKALAKYTDRHIIEVPLNRIKTYEGLRNIMLGNTISDFIIPHHKRLYLIEDIDCLDNIIYSRKDFKKNESKISKKITEEDHKEDDELRLSHVLNIIDGMLEAPGRILVITTNYPDRLDEALIRDGRMDIKLEMKPLEGECLKNMILSFYPEKSLKDLNPFLPLKNRNGFTPATIQAYCFKKDFEEVCQILK